MSPTFLHGASPTYHVYDERDAETVFRLIQERDHARDVACRLEQELARVQATQPRGETQTEANEQSVPSS